MPSLLPHLEPDGLLEYSVVYTDRAYNHMSATFMAAMRDIDRRLEEDSRRLSAEVARDTKNLEAELKKADAEASAMYGKFEEEEKRNRDIEIEIKVKRKHEKGN